jgi:hypothetical protein
MSNNKKQLSVKTNCLKNRGGANDNFGEVESLNND